MRAGLCVLLVACAGDKAVDSAAGDSGDDAEITDLVAFLAAPGEYTAGYRVTEVAYDSSEGPRTMRFGVWYPTSDTAGENPRYNNLVPTDNALLDATLADGGPWPLHVYSHGHQGYAEASGFFMEHLASHGFVVAAPDHTGNTTLDGGDRDTEIYYLRTEDIGASIDAVLAADGELGFLAGAVDGDDISASGHSFGGYTLHALAGAVFDDDLMAQCLDGSDTSAYCSTMTDDMAAHLQGGLADPRIGSFVSMAPGDFRLFGADGLSQTDRPILHMTGDLDPQTGGDSDDIWAALQDGINRRVDIAGGGHQTFTDFSGTLETMDGLIDAETGFVIVNTYATGWLLHQSGRIDASELFDGTLTVDPAANLLQ